MSSLSRRLIMAIVSTACLALFACSPESLSDCEWFNCLFDFHRELAGEWSGDLVGESAASLDGGESTAEERSEPFTIAFDEDGFLVGLTFLPPSPSYWSFWPRRVAAVSEVGDSYSYERPAHQGGDGQSVVLEELVYAPNAASLRSGWSYFAWIGLDGVRHSTIEGTATTDVEVHVDGDQLSVVAHVIFEFERWSIDTDVTHQVTETWTAMGTLTRAEADE